MALFHRRQPAPQHNDYRRYKVYLREDFYYCCAYCTIHENEWGGPRHFHVEHFRPKSRFSDLIADYQNLLYACDVCNIFKGDDWPSDEPLVDGVGYLDPCEHDYDEHFVVADDYQLQGITPVAAYMVEHLHLNRRQLQILRQKRAREIAIHNRFLQLIEETLVMIDSSLEDDTVPLHAQQSLLMAREMLQLERDDRLQAWSKCWHPLYNLEDYR
jgi:hypothetical protein